MTDQATPSEAEVEAAAEALADVYGYTIASYRHDARTALTAAYAVREDYERLRGYVNRRYGVYLDPGTGRGDREYTDTDEELAMANAYIADLSEQLNLAKAAYEKTSADLFAHMDAAKVREVALAESRGEVERLREALERIGPHKGNRSCRGLPTCPYCIVADVLNPFELSGEADGY